MLNADGKNRARILQALAVAAFLAYAIGAIAAFHHRPTKWAAEYDLAFPVAISNILYGVPLGLVDSNVHAAYRGVLQREGVNAETVSKAVEFIARGDIPRGAALPTMDGTGLGQLLFSTISMRLFGPRLSSLSYGFLLLMGMSALAYIARFDDPRLLAVPLQFTALSVMLIGPLAADQRIADQVPIGGNRYFGVLGILPAIHLFLEFAGTAGRRDARRAPLDFLALGVQLATLALVLLVRSASAYVLAPIAGAFAYRLWNDFGNHPARRQILRKAAIAISLFAACLALLISCVPSYAKSGRIAGIFWHRAFISFVLHPEWPYGSLRQTYDCAKYTPEGLNRIKDDRNGHCVWWTYAQHQGLTIEETQARLYGPEYEAVVRKAYFDVVRAFPRQTLELYAIYKPLRIAETLYSSLDFQMSKASTIAVLLASLQLILLSVFSAVASATAPLPLRQGAWLVAGFFALSLTPALAAWASLWTSVDIIFYMYASLGLALCLAVERVMGALRGPVKEQRTGAACD